MIKVLFCAATTVVAVALATAPAWATDYRSPDGAIIAQINSSGRSCEAKIIIRSGGRELTRQQYVSKDHEHGACVRSAAWTADSRFFVYSLMSSGGHQPWHAPIMVFSRVTGQVVALEDYVSGPIVDVAGTITEPSFVLRTPDVIEFFTAQTGSINSVRQSVSLTKLLH